MEILPWLRAEPNHPGAASLARMRAEAMLAAIPGIPREGCFLRPLALVRGSERMRAGVPFSSGLPEGMLLN